MTDKLAEAIKWTGAACDSGLMLEVNVAKDIVEAARSYHAMPVVDVDSLLLKQGQDLTYGFNNCILHLRAKYPNGLRWAE